MQPNERINLIKQYAKELKRLLEVINKASLVDTSRTMRLLLDLILTVRSRLLEPCETRYLGMYQTRTDIEKIFPISVRWRNITAQFIILNGYLVGIDLVNIEGQNCVAPPIVFGNERNDEIDAEILRQIKETINKDPVRMQDVSTRYLDEGINYTICWLIALKWIV